jgi:hypothetical protein
MPFYRPEVRRKAAGQWLIQGSSQELSNGEGEGGTTRCRATSAVGSPKGRRCGCSMRAETAWKAEARRGWARARGATAVPASGAGVGSTEAVVLRRWHR